MSFLTPFTNVFSATKIAYNKIFTKPVIPAKKFYENLLESSVPQLTMMLIDDEQFYKHSRTFLAQNHRDLCTEIETEAQLVDGNDQHVAKVYEFLACMMRCVIDRTSSGGDHMDINYLMDVFDIDGVLGLYDDPAIHDDTKAGLGVFLNNIGFVPVAGGNSMPLQSQRTLAQIAWLTDSVQKRLAWFKELHTVMQQVARGAR